MRACGPAAMAGGSTWHQGALEGTVRLRRLPAGVGAVSSRLRLLTVVVLPALAGIPAVGEGTESAPTRRLAATL